jgi:hypothetical protein
LKDSDEAASPLENEFNENDDEEMKAANYRMHIRQQAQTVPL